MNAPNAIAPLSVYVLWCILYNSSLITIPVSFLAVNRWHSKTRYWGQCNKGTIYKGGGQRQRNQQGKVKLPMKSGSGKARTVGKNEGREQLLEPEIQRRVVWTPGMDLMDPLSLVEGCTQLCGQPPAAQQGGRCVEQTPWPLFLFILWSPTRISHWSNPPGNQRAKEPIDAVHTGQAPRAQSRVEKSRKQMWREDGSNNQFYGATVNV